MTGTFQRCCLCHKAVVSCVVPAYCGACNPRLRELVKMADLERQGREAADTPVVVDSAPARSNGGGDW